MVWACLFTLQTTLLFFVIMCCIAVFPYEGELYHVDQFVQRIGVGTAYTCIALTYLIASYLITTALTGKRHSSQAQVLFFLTFHVAAMAAVLLVFYFY